MDRHEVGAFDAPTDHWLSAAGVGRASRARQALVRAEPRPMARQTPTFRRMSAYTVNAFVAARVREISGSLRHAQRTNRENIIRMLFAAVLAAAPFTANAGSPPRVGHAGARPPQRAGTGCNVGSAPPSCRCKPSPPSHRGKVRKRHKNPLEADFRELRGPTLARPQDSLPSHQPGPRGRSGNCRQTIQIFVHRDRIIAHPNACRVVHRIGNRRADAAQAKFPHALTLHGRRLIIGVI